MLSAHSLSTIPPATMIAERNRRMKPFPQEEEPKTKSARLNELNAMLNLDKIENEIVDGERAGEEPSRTGDDRER